MPNILISVMRFLYKEKEAEGGGTGTEEVRSCSCVCHRPYEAHTHSLLICFSKHRLWKKKRYAETVIVNMRYLLVSNPAHAALIALFNSQQKIDIDVSPSISFSLYDVSIFICLCIKTSSLRSFLSGMGGCAECHSSRREF